jgi:hypothetical protein
MPHTCTHCSLPYTHPDPTSSCPLCNPGPNPDSIAAQFLTALQTFFQSESITLHTNLRHYDLDEYDLDVFTGAARDIFQSDTLIFPLSFTTAKHITPATLLSYIHSHLNPASPHSA